MKLIIVTVGKRHDASIADAISEYQKRLERVLAVDWMYIAPSTLQLQEARKAESAKILASLKDSDMVWLLDERGEQISSTALSAKIETLQVHAVGRLVLIIGGAYGVDDNVRQRAQWVWSLSTLVFPHQIVRLMLAEQLYRATEIAKGSGYHHA
jgi:23S rRNA (pseudouridine1915-N3)-methyltransferase